MQLPRLLQVKMDAVAPSPSARPLYMKALLRLSIGAERQKRNVPYLHTYMTSAIRRREGCPRGRLRERDSDKGRVVQIRKFCGLRLSLVPNVPHRMFRLTQK